jgi:hypothetical protein
MMSVCIPFLQIVYVVRGIPVPFFSSILFSLSGRGGLRVLVSQKVWFAQQAVGRRNEVTEPSSLGRKTARLSGADVNGNPA